MRKVVKANSSINIIFSFSWFGFCFQCPGFSEATAGSIWAGRPFDMLPFACCNKYAVLSQLEAPSYSTSTSSANLSHIPQYPRSTSPKQPTDLTASAIRCVHIMLYAVYHMLYLYRRGSEWGSGISIADMSCEPPPGHVPAIPLLDS